MWTLPMPSLIRPDVADWHLADCAVGAVSPILKRSGNLMQFYAK
jgi:hypothetical protein